MKNLKYIYVILVVVFFTLFVCGCRQDETQGSETLPTTIETNQETESRTESLEETEKLVAEIESATEKTEESVAEIESATEETEESVAEIESVTEEAEESVAEIESATEETEESVAEIESVTEEAEESVAELESITEETEETEETIIAPIDHPIDGSEGLEYRKDEDHYNVVGIGTCTDSDLKIPSSYGGYPVEAIDDYAFSGCTHLKSVTIPDSVTYLGNGIFAGCRSLESLDLPFLPHGCLHYLFEKIYIAEDDGEGYKTFGELGEGKTINIDTKESHVEDYFYGINFLSEQSGEVLVLVPLALNTVSIRGGNLEGISVCTKYYERLNYDKIGSLQGFYKLTSIIVPNGIESVPVPTFFDYYFIKDAEILPPESLECPYAICVPRP